MNSDFELPFVLDTVARASAKRAGISFNSFVCAALFAHVEAQNNPHRLMSDAEYKATTWRAPWAAGYSLEKKL